MVDGAIQCTVMDFNIRKRTFRKVFALGKVPLFILCVCLFLVFLKKEFLRPGSASVTVLPSNLVNTKDIKQTVSSSNENENRLAINLPEYQKLNRKSVELDGEYRYDNKVDIIEINNTNKRFENCRLYPDILIVGFEKCGTITLRSFLGTHPQIFITNSKLNIPYFNSVNYMSFETFTKHMPCTPTRKLRLEKVSIYGSAVNVYKTIPNVKLLAILREPVERAMSHHVHQIARRKEKNRNFDTTIKSLLDGGTQGNQTVKTSVLFRQSTFIDRLQQWLQTYGRDKIHVVDGDNFVIHPALELNKVEKFLNISPYFTSDHFIFNSEKKFYCLKRAKKGTRANGCMNRGKGRSHPKMSEVTRKRLQDYFKPFNEKLFLAIGQNFSWNY